MKVTDIKTIGIAGGGTMGIGIARAVAQSGLKAVVYDVDGEAVENAQIRLEKSLKRSAERGKLSETEQKQAFDNIEFTTNIKDLVSGLVIETVVEDFDTKVNILREIENNNDSRSIIATNTSGLSVNKLASRLKHPQRFLGLHFFHPAHLLKLTEIVVSEYTASEFVDLAEQFAARLDKETILSKDEPGFIVNRVARPFFTESMKIVEEGVADFKTVDKLVESFGLKMGPFRLMDFQGIDINLATTKSIYDAFFQAPRFRPSRYQQQKVEVDQLGRKSGKGFYSYEEEI